MRITFRYGPSCYAAAAACCCICAAYRMKCSIFYKIHILGPLFLDFVQWIANVFPRMLEKVPGEKIAVLLQIAAQMQHNLRFAAHCISSVFLAEIHETLQLGGI